LNEAEQGQHELFMSLINLGEVFYRIGQVRGEEAARETVEELKSLPITLLPADEDAVFSAARLKIAHRLSYADAFAVAAALARDATLLTGDPEIRGLTGVIPLAPLHRTLK
jgi:predicted nucleic acid-binding protein